MKIATTLATVLVAATTLAATGAAASASPWQSSYAFGASASVTYGAGSVRDHRSHPAPAPLPPPASRWRDHRGDRDDARTPARPRFDVRADARPGWTIDPPRRAFDHWVDLGAVATGKQQITLPSGTTYGSLELTTTGRVQMNEVAIEFANHQTQVVQVRRMVDARSPVWFQLASGNGSILRVIVYTAQAAAGQVTVLAR